MSFLRTYLPLTLTAALGLSACTSLTQLPGPRTISVAGTGQARAAPDLAMVTLGVQTQDANIGVAVRQNNQQAEAVREAILEAGVAPEDVQTASFNVSQQQRVDEFGNPTGEVLYTVNNTVSVRLRNLDALGDLLEAALDQGATSVNGVTFSVEDPSDALSRARQEAVEDARAHADQLASASGASLGRVLSISETGPAPIPRVEAAPLERAAAGVPISPGTLEFQVQVFIVYEIE